MATESLIQDDAAWHPELVYLVHRAVSVFPSLLALVIKPVLFFYQRLLRLAFRLLILLIFATLCFLVSETAEKKRPGRLPSG